MVYKITEKCIECNSCYPFCEKGAILTDDSPYTIDQSKCDGCGTCKEYCPIDDAIVEITENTPVV